MTHLSETVIEPEARHVAPLRAALAEALAAPIDRRQGFYAIDGMSGARYRRFVNALIRRLGRVGYLEVGSWMGSTLCSAIHGNAVQAVAIDNWSQFGGPRDVFLANLAQFRTPAASVEVIESDFRAVPFAALAERHRPFEVYLFDGPHEEQDQHDGLVAALPALAEEFVFICDDWNWWQVRAGTHRAIVQAGLTMLYGAEIRTTLDNSHAAIAFKDSDWHNGYFVSVLRKPRRMQQMNLAFAA
jgi:hypothetical protein